MSQGGPDALEMAHVEAQRSGKVTVWYGGRSKRSANREWVSDYRNNPGWNLDLGM